MQNVKLFKRIVIAAVLTLLMAGWALAQTREQQDWMAANAIRVHNWHGNQSDTGTGVLLNIGGQSYVATNHHVASRPPGRLQLVFPNGQKGGGEIVASDPQMDVVIIKPAGDVKGGASIGCFTGKGRFFIAGFGGGPGRLHFHATTVLRTTGVGNGPYSWTDLRNCICSGDSGSGVFNEAGEVVGVMWGTSHAEGTCVGTLGAPFEALLVKVGYEANHQPIAEPQQYSEWVGVESDCPTCPRPSQPSPLAPPEQLPGVIYYAPTPPGGRTENPAPAPVTPPSPVAPECDCRDLIARIKALEARKPEKGERGEQGLAGKDGAPGPQGPQGPAGKDAVFDVEAVAAAITKTLPPINVEQQDFNTGEVLDTGQVKLGGTLVLRYGIKGESKDARPQ